MECGDSGTMDVLCMAGDIQRGDGEQCVCRLQDVGIKKISIFLDVWGIS